MAERCIFKKKIDGLKLLPRRKDSVTCRANALLSRVYKFGVRGEALSDVDFPFHPLCYTELALPPYRIRANILKAFTWEPTQSHKLHYILCLDMTDAGALEDAHTSHCYSEADKGSSHRTSHKRIIKTLP